MSCLVPPAKRVWRVLRARLGLRRTTTRAGAGAGLGRLRKEVRACYYSDVHVMWDMLSKSSSSTGHRRRPTAGNGAVATRRARTRRNAAAVASSWSQHGSNKKEGAGAKT